MTMIRDQHDPVRFQSSLCTYCSHRAHVGPCGECECLSNEGVACNVAAQLPTFTSSASAAANWYPATTITFGNVA
jgi:hypothetical protein